MSDNREEQREGAVPEVALPERPESGATTAIPTGEQPAEQPASFAETPAEQPASVPVEEHSPRVARSASNKPVIGEAGRGAESASGAPVRPGVRRGTPRARRMNLSLTRLNVWSVAKVSFMMGVAGAIIQIVAATLVWLLLSAVGVFGQITNIVASTGLDTGGLDLTSVFSLPTVLSVVTILAIVGIVLWTLLCTILAAIYNVVSSLVGGIHVTLGDD
ncbi:hypothetical protein BW13_08175 [Bifidobacterium sp. UTCIF-37]|uniref:DUF3566 domain-containing protein n=1 Tax=unclassified Bifidobacterium TaxID=2608897 RepID=UPI00112B3760|nr:MULTISPECIES: DUF3566 domain-containing protein [unclassified Bifidobacterium]TPF85931.1 hypothetical protein BW13_08175 [Bifidobacterium sp. UTCIF-37]TPF89088.1 hypothetical protein BW11_05865 [Bifidobacterium sp. UTCIF-38]